MRDRWLARPTVRVALAKIPVGRWIADAHARRLFGLVAGFAQSQMLTAALELGVFDRLAGGPIEEDALAEALSLDPRGHVALLQALRAMHLIESRSGGSIALTIDGLVVATDPGIRAMIAHNRLLYADLQNPAAMLRAPGTGRVAAFWPYAGSAGRWTDYAALMAASQDLVLGALLDAVDFNRFEHVVDVGGGDGSVLAAVADRYPSPRLTLVDLPDVLDRARVRLAETHPTIMLVVGGGALPLPRGADAITLVRVLHDHDDDPARALLRKAADALAPNGRLIVAEPVAHRGNDPQAAYFAAYFAAMGSGRLRSRQQIESLLGEAGLHPTRLKGGKSFLVDVILARHRSLS
jgi:demethylspheroidene O-methyltransferase